MKKVILLTSYFSISFSFLFSQVNTFPTTSPGNVGIGTTAPAGALEIQRDPSVAGNEIYFTGQSGANQNSNSLRLNFVGYAQTAGFGIQAINASGYGTKDLVFYAHDLNKHADYTSYDEVVRFMYNGNVGIGTSTPGSKLDIINTGGGISFTNTTTTEAIGFNREAATGALFNSGRVAYQLTIDNTSFRIEGYNGAASNPLTILKGGNIGIGTSTPNAKLDVNGSIYAKDKIYIGVSDANTATNMGTNLLAVNGSALFNKVTVKVPLWPDYVFSPTYKLTPLDSLEQFIQLNKHLPEVPTADDVKKNGIDLGDNQALLLKKIEELTLIVIEQNKRIEKLENKLKLKAKVNK